MLAMLADVDIFLESFVVHDEIRHAAWWLYVSFFLCLLFSRIHILGESYPDTKHPRLHWNYLFNPVGFVSLQVNSCSYHSFLYFTYSTKIDIEQLLLSVYYMYIKRIFSPFDKNITKVYIQRYLVILKSNHHWNITDSSNQRQFISKNR